MKEAGARARVGHRGVGRRPTKHDACAKVEQSTVHDPQGPKYYCGKNFKKPRISAGDAALLEDERRKDLWRLFLSRNSPYINGIILSMLFFLCANVDAQVVTTLKGASDYVCKYITKYGAGQSVNARVASLIDDIITKLPEDKKYTVAGVMAKAFIATAVPDTLASLEAWHVLFGLKRACYSRGFASLNLDTALRQVACPSVKSKKNPAKKARAGNEDTVGDDASSGNEEAKTLAKKTPPEIYADREEEGLYANEATAQWASEAAMVDFMVTALRPGTTVPSAKHARMELLARCLLHLDLEPFEPNRKGLKKPSLPTACLRDAAKAWCEYHPMEKKETLQSLRENQPYTVLWQNLKRQALKQLGFTMVSAPSRRIYFD